MTKLFLPHSQLETWALSEQADLREGRLVVTADGGKDFSVTPAVHFLQVVSGNDEHGLLTKVKTEAQLQSLGAEQMADSVLLGETAYEVVSGFVTEVEGPPRSEADLLAAFLLNKLG